MSSHQPMTKKGKVNHHCYCGNIELSPLCDICDDWIIHNSQQHRGDTKDV
eukprot:gnl/Chilomastix_caulleri/6813.p3 GENE.gnl/Chilomastix_caulleri/6813~~gnl/Chilomastix_caulleri/6813.p3  ORF type:complete len:50 (-),score=13.06 gnl/Chilomastix_caulleri/6813:170-319(-)